MPRARLRTAIAVTAMITILGAASPAFAATGWTTAGYDHADALTQSQGVATIVRPGGTQLRYTGVGTIPLSVRSEGWDHVGDPDSVAGYYVEPYEHAGATAKMYRAQAPDGTWREYVHPLGTDEAYNNSFDAISPSGAWMLSGEWNTSSPSASTTRYATYRAVPSSPCRPCCAPPTTGPPTCSAW